MTQRSCGSSSTTTANVPTLPFRPGTILTLLINSVKRSPARPTFPSRAGRGSAFHEDASDSYLSASSFAFTASSNGGGIIPTGIRFPRPIDAA
jgi:hypothetical protein